MCNLKLSKSFQIFIYSTNLGMRARRWAHSMLRHSGEAQSSAFEELLFQNPAVKNQQTR